MLEQLATADALRRAWRRVRANGGGRGGDGVTLEAFARGLDDRLARLGDDLLAGRYRPGPLREAPLRRPDGRVRLLRIPGVGDRVVQTACQQLVSSRLDPRMSADSFGYRPARSVDQAIARIEGLAANGARWAFDADIAAFFDRVPHDRLRDELAIWLDDARMIALIGMWLKGFGGGRGLAQGAPISPLLANLYLHPLDRALAGAGASPVRYADDFVALTRSRAGAEAARRTAAAALRRRGLALNPAKSHIVALADGFEFLGRTLRFPGA